MRPISVTLFTIALAASSLAARSDTRTDVGISIGTEGITSFYLAIGEYYRVPQREIIVIREQRIPDYEIPVVLFIAKQAKLAPATIVSYRERGWPWMRVAVHLGLRPDIFYVPVEDMHDYGPPYGHAYGHYKNKPKKQWRAIQLDDDDVVNLVNLRFISERYGYPPEKVIRMRSEGRDFVGIHQDARQARPGKPGKSEQHPRMENREHRQENRGGRNHRDD